MELAKKAETTAEDARARVQQSIAEKDKAEKNAAKAVTDSEAAAAAVAVAQKTVYKAASSDKGRVLGGDDEDAVMGLDKASCSCLFGNPCAVPENCKDWHNRFDVAKKNGWKGFS